MKTISVHKFWDVVLRRSGIYALLCWFNR